MTKPERDYVKENRENIQHIKENAVEKYLDEKINGAVLELCHKYNLDLSEGPVIRKYFTDIIYALIERS